MTADTDAVAPDSLVARARDAARLAANGPFLRELADGLEQLQRERDAEKVRADAYNEKFQKQCKAVDEESHRARMAESRLARITQAADAMRDAYVTVTHGVIPYPVAKYDAITTEG